MQTVKPERRQHTHYRLSDHPWASLAVVWITAILVLLLVAAGAHRLGLPENAVIRPLITPTLAHVVLLFILVPLVFHLPEGKKSYRAYLTATRLQPVRPLIPLLLIGIGCSFFFLTLLSFNSILLRVIQGFSVDLTFLKYMIDLQRDLPPQSHGWIVAIPSIFEEIAWRGVLLPVFMRQYPPRKSIVITALGFGLLHLLNLLSGVALYFVILQVILGSTLGIFYGYLVLRTNSLIPAMLFHYLVNLFIGSFTFYFQRQASGSTQILFALASYPVYVTLLLFLTKAFCKRWIPEPQNYRSIRFTRSN